MGFFFFFFRILPITGRCLVNLMPTVSKNWEQQPLSCTSQVFPERHQSCFQCAAMLLVLISFLGIHFFLGESNILTVVDAHNSLFLLLNFSKNSFHHEACITITNLSLILQMSKHRQFPSLMPMSLSSKETRWS